MKFSNRGVFCKCDQICRKFWICTAWEVSRYRPKKAPYLDTFHAVLVAFTEEILNGKLCSLCNLCNLEVYKSADYNSTHLFEKRISNTYILYHNELLSILSYIIETRLRTWKCFVINKWICTNFSFKDIKLLEVVI